MRTFLTALLCVGLLLGGCAERSYDPAPRPTPIVDPPPIPIPPDPEPIDVPDDGPVLVVVAWEKTQQVVAGMSVADLKTLLGAPHGTRSEGDGSSIMRWPAVNAEGKPRWYDVQVEGDVVLGPGALWKR